MQYTQQQRLAPEAPDESALYSPIDYEREDSEERWQHAGDGCEADEVSSDRVLLPIEERISNDATATGTRQTAVS